MAASYKMGRVRVDIEPGCTDTACHIWRGSVNSKGYGVRTVAGRGVLAHRHAYLISGREIPEGTHLHHICGNRRCVNSLHLEVVTPLEHNREHTDNPISLRIIEALSDGQRHRYRDLQHIAPGTNIGTILARLVKRGEIQRVGRGTYRETP